MLELVLGEVADGVEQGRLQAREREIEPGHARDREIERGGVPLAGEPVDRRAARVAEAEEPRALVESLAGGVVESRAEYPEAARLGDVDQQGMAAACEQAEERRLDPLGLQVERCDVAMQVIDRDQRQAVRP